MVRRMCVLAGLVLLMSACGTEDQASTGDGPTRTATETVTVTPSPSTTTAPDGGTESAPPEAADTKCVAMELEGEIANADAGAGNRYANLVVTNKSQRECTLYGYGGLEFVDADGNANPTDLVRTPNPGPSLVTLAPGESAAKKLHWGVVPTGDEPATGRCQPPSAGIRVIPPDDTQAFVVSHDFGSVCGAGHVEGSAYFTP
ncbi:DUF4232 domain-containing protein [Actinophytocola gossypii]|uniref:DUF4232 domain-containing protein n=1 Tax=Actinophytocola gossypii TaxID=2812003 RepID=A0ABT2J4G8_9PSEU|nr:DUF4232 domain-containing protein [Actinophytocola gossypii]MCT2582756.1 DUF4232 domain-containing protein [Actinophytocola gossypii]